MMTTTRERLDRRNRVARILFIVLGVVVVLALVAGALALWLLPPILAESPRERFPGPTDITLRTDAVAPGTPSTSGGTATTPGATVTASASIGAEWLALGVGPFLDPSTAAFVSPDDAYRADLTLLPLRGTSPDDVLAGYLADHDLDSAASGAAWSEETLTSGLTARYADLVQGSDTVTVAMIEQPSATDASAAPDAPTDADADADADPPAVLVLRATVASADAPRYRPVTADLAASVTLAATSEPAP